jgi:hypothetical protein
MRSKFTERGSGTACKQFFAAIRCSANTDASWFVRFWTDQLDVGSFNWEFYVQTTALWAFGVSASNVLVDEIHAFNGNFASGWIHGQYGAACPLTVSGDDLDSVALANLHFRNS